MFRSPGDHADLFKQYGVRYVLISNPELGYTIDYAYFEQNGTIVASNGAGTLYLLSDPS
jgi:hypothetical protein